jgi:rhamnosyltransferase
LIALSAIDDIGLMDEGLFIDHVDTEWFLRAKSKGYQAFGVCGAVMQHGLGEQTHQVSLLTARGRGRQRNVPQHKPFRYYYIFRNSILLYKRNYASGLWKWNDSQRLLMIAVMFGVFKAPRWKNLKMMYKGLIDGAKGVSGPAELN